MEPYSNPLAPEQPTGRSAWYWVRTAIAFWFAAWAVLWCAGGLLIGLSAIVLTDPSKPLRALTVAGAVPQVRAEIARVVAEGYEEEYGAMTPDARVEYEQLMADVLAAPAFQKGLREFGEDSTDESLDGLLALVADDLREVATGTGAEEAKALKATADMLEAGTFDGLEEELASGDGEWRSVRGYGLVAAGVALVVGLVSGAVGVAVANRRGLTAATIASATAVLAAVLLASGSQIAPVLPAWLAVVAHVCQGLGMVLGTAAVWGLLVVALLPFASWALAWQRRQDRALGLGA